MKMARARKCDICKSYYDEYNNTSKDTKPNTLFFVRKDMYGENHTQYVVDCCPVCMDELELHCICKKESKPT